MRPFAGSHMYQCKVLKELEGKLQVKLVLSPSWTHSKGGCHSTVKRLVTPVQKDKVPHRNWFLYRVFIAFTHSQILESWGAWLHPPPSPSPPRLFRMSSAAPGLRAKMKPQDQPWGWQSVPLHLFWSSILSRGTFCSLDLWNMLVQRIGFCTWLPNQSETRPHACARNTPTISALESVAWGSKWGIKHCSLETNFTNIEMSSLHKENWQPFRSGLLNHGLLLFNLREWDGSMWHEFCFG